MLIGIFCKEISKINIDEVELEVEVVIVVEILIFDIVLEVVILEVRWL